MLFLLSAVMLVGSYVAGIIPLIVTLSEVIPGCPDISG